MIEIKGRNLCENCFAEATGSVCSACGYDPGSGADDPTLLAPGSILFGKYVIGTVIGKGGFGVTYLAFDTVAERKVAIKEYFPYSIARRAAGSPTVTVSSEENKKAFSLGAEKFYEEAKLEPVHINRNVRIAKRIFRITRRFFAGILDVFQEKSTKLYGKSAARRALSVYVNTL